MSHDEVHMSGFHAALLCRHVIRAPTRFEPTTYGVTGRGSRVCRDKSVYTLWNNHRVVVRSTETGDRRGWYRDVRDLRRRSSHAGARPALSPNSYQFPTSSLRLLPFSDRHSNRLFL